MKVVPVITRREAARDRASANFQSAELLILEFVCQPEASRIARHSAELFALASPDAKQDRVREKERVVIVKHATAARIGLIKGPPRNRRGVINVAVHITRGVFRDN